ncbi:hypothetical protein TWF694_006087 [Orbilia ellipsospora]|uniref:DUF7908 domain-containing protein n=1 Tax=Orbilia ellipsospora TaxID=2528407 RepID=A0AAV9WRD8_9PEZI
MMVRSLFYVLFFFSILSSTWVVAIPTPEPHSHANSESVSCRGRRPLGYITPSPGATPIPITSQGQRVTTYVPTAIVHKEDARISVTKYLTSTYVWYSTYIPGYPDGRPLFISRGDQIITLPPRKTPKYAVRTVTYTVPGVYELEGQAHQVDNVPAEIQYVKEISRTFGTCQVHDYFEWLKSNDLRVARIEANTQHGDQVDQPTAYGFKAYKPWSHIQQPVLPRLAVNYTRCEDDVCTLEKQKWSVGYSAQIRKRVFTPKFTGWCDGNGPCELCVEIPGHGKLSTTINVHTPGPCSISTRLTTEITTTKTITRTKIISTTVQTTVTLTVGPNPVNLPEFLGETPSTTNSKSATSTQSVQSTSVSISSSATTDKSISSVVTSSSTSSTVASTEIPTNASPFRIRIRDVPPKSISRRADVPSYIRIFDNNMYIATNPNEAAIFSIFNKQLKSSTNEVAFADPDDLAEHLAGPILVALNPTGPSTVFSVAANTNKLIWTNVQFKREKAAFCVDSDQIINGVYAGNIGPLCHEVELTAEFIDGHSTSPTSNLSTSAGPSSSPPTLPSISEVAATTSAPTSSIESSTILSTGLQVTSSSATPSTTITSSQCTAISLNSNHIQNSGFESGAFAPWTPTAAGGSTAEYSISKDNPRGDKSSFLVQLTETSDSSVSLTQTIATCPNRMYKGSVWVNLSVKGGAPTGCALVILINEVAVAIHHQDTAGSYTQVPFNFTAATRSSKLKILSICTDGVDKGIFHIDDIMLHDSASNTR